MNAETALGPLVPLTVAARHLGVSRATLGRRIERGEIPVVCTAPRKRWIPRRVLDPQSWTGGSLTRAELAAALGVSYASVSRAIVRGHIPVLPDGCIPELWIAEHCDPDAYDRSQRIAFV